MKWARLLPRQAELVGQPQHAVLGVADARAPLDGHGTPGRSSGHRAPRVPTQGVPAIAPCQVGGRAGLVDEREACRIHEALPSPPAAALWATSGRSCSAALKDLILCLRPSRQSAFWSVESAANEAAAALEAVHSSASCDVWGSPRPARAGESKAVGIWAMESRGRRVYNWSALASRK
jgi:hypothetical protein